jgi:methionyl-tRNA formyltransferase
MIIGSSRLFGGAKDMALEVVQSILQSPHQLAVVFVKPNDPALSYACLQQRQIPTFTLPNSLCGTYLEIKQNTAQTQFIEEFQQLKTIPFDLGISFYADWLPPMLINLPRFGFINLHPAPLPMLTGYEAERFHVLTDHRKSWGTIHYLAEKFDVGNILARGNMTELPEDMTPMTVYEQLIAHSIPALLQVINNFAQNRTTIIGEPQNEMLRTYATHQDAIRESVIRWEADSNRKLDCRFRAYCTANDGISLHAIINQQLCEITNMIILPEQTPNSKISSPGQIIGNYPKPKPFQNAIAVKTLEGVALVEIKN